jgi:hypothetical protein
MSVQSGIEKLGSLRSAHRLYWDRGRLARRSAERAQWLGCLASRCENKGAEMDFHQSSTPEEWRLAVPVRASRLGGRDARGPSNTARSPG